MEAKIPTTFDSIEEIGFGLNPSYFGEDGEPVTRIGPLSRINIFVGANNSGKSRLIRQLACQEQYGVTIVSYRATQESIASMSAEVAKAMTPWSLQKFGPFNVAHLSELERILRAAQFDLGSDAVQSARVLISQWSLSASNGTNPALPSDDVRKRIFEQISGPIESIKGLVHALPEFSAETFPSRVYIPTLRGLRPLAGDHTDHYKQATVAAYFDSVRLYQDEKGPPQRGELEVYTGLSFFTRLRALRLGRTADRRSVEGYESFLSNTFFEGQNIELVPSEMDGVVSIKIGKEAEQPIHHLGDGVQHAIILSFLSYVKRDEPAFFFIEEPEICMHPGLQRKLLNFFVEQKLHKYFLATHSNHLLDLTTDIKSVSVFTLRKRGISTNEDEISPTFTVRDVHAGCPSSLDLLGVRNSSVFLVNSTIWVEGITDRFYLRRMLEAYMALRGKRKFEEDVHYSFVEYGGSNIIHWSFLDLDVPQIQVDRLCAQAMVIVDRDGGKKLDRKERISKKLGRDRFIEIDGNEIENTLPYLVIRDVVTKLEKDEHLTLPDFSYEKYKGVPIGRFIQRQMLRGVAKRRGGYEESSGTLKDKTGFCEKALPLIKYDDLPLPTKDLVRKIYRFIASRNVNE